MSDLDIEAFLRAERAPAADADKNKDAARDRLEMILGPLVTVGAAASAASSGSAAATKTASTTARTVAGYKAYLLLLGGFVAGVGAHAALDRVRSHPASSAVPKAIAISATSASPSATASTTVEVPERDVETLPLAPVPSSASTSPTTRVSMDSATDLAAESTLLETARTALERNDPTHAMLSLDRHRQRFPNGQLREERESLMIYALVAQGDMDEARAKTAAFHRQFQNSLQGPALDKLVASP